MHHGHLNASSYRPTEPPAPAAATTTPKPPKKQFHHHTSLTITPSPTYRHALFPTVQNEQRKLSSRKFLEQILLCLRTRSVPFVRKDDPQTLKGLQWILFLELLEHCVIRQLSNLSAPEDSSYRLIALNTTQIIERVAERTTNRTGAPTELRLK